MKRFAFLLIFSLGVVSASREVSAQPPGGGFRGFGGFVMFGGDKLMLLGQESVQKELKLTDKQTKQVTQRREKQRESMVELRDLEPEDVQKKLAKQAKSTDAALSKLLKPDQFKRLKQIALQQQGTRALSDAEVAKSLGLTSEQKTKLQNIQEESQKDFREAFQANSFPGGRGEPGAGGPRFGAQRPGSPPPDGQTADGQPPGAERTDGQRPSGPRPGGRQGGPGGPGDRPGQAEREAAFAKMEELRKSVDEKLLAVLTTDQQTKWQEMRGEPFQLEFRRPDFRGGNRRDGDAPGENRPNGKGPRSKQRDPDA